MGGLHCNKPLQLDRCHKSLVCSMMTHTQVKMEDKFLNYVQFYTLLHNKSSLRLPGVTKRQRSETPIAQHLDFVERFRSESS